MKHDEVVKRVVDALVIKLVVERKNASDGQIVDLSRDSYAQSFGFGVTERTSNETVISQVQVGGLAEGVLMANDVMTTINELKVESSTHAGRVAIIKSSLSIRLTIQRAEVARDAEAEGGLASTWQH